MYSKIIKKMRKLAVLLLGLFSFFLVNSQDFEDTVYSPLVRTVKFYQTGSQLSYPVLDLNGSHTLTLRFDIMADHPLNLQYTFVHCSWDWTEEDLYEQDYLDGYYTNRLWDYRQSFNANVSYFNYSVKFPNEYVRFLVSGNYLIRVSLVSDPDSVILQKRFVVVEKLLPVSVSVHPATNSALRLSHQEVDVKFDITGHGFDDPYNNMRVAIYQNFRPDMVAYLLEPKFFQGGQMIYDYDDINVFPAGNEFRTFSTVDFKFHSGKVFKSEFKNGVYNSYLLPDNVQGAYASYRDANGNFIIRAANVENPWSEADYVKVHFALWTKHPLLHGGDVYVFGGLTNWKIRPDFKLKYDPGAQGYVGAILLKQGVYDYHYVVVRDGQVYYDELEGSFYQTGNDYLVFVYYQDQAPYYWRVVGYRKVEYR